MIRKPEAAPAGFVLPSLADAGRSGRPKQKEEGDVAIPFETRCGDPAYCAGALLAGAGVLGAAELTAGALLTAGAELATAGALLATALLAAGASLLAVDALGGALAALVEGAAVVGNARPGSVEADDAGAAGVEALEAPACIWLRASSTVEGAEPPVLAAWLRMLSVP